MFFSGHTPFVLKIFIPNLVKVVTRGQMTLLSNVLCDTITLLRVALGIMPVFSPLFSVSQCFHMKHFSSAIKPAERARFMGRNQFLAVGTSRKRDRFKREMAR